MTKPDWPCPKCGAPSVRDPHDGYLRKCTQCGHRAAFEAFAPKMARLTGRDRFGPCGPVQALLSDRITEAWYAAGCPRGA